MESKDFYNQAIKLMNDIKNIEPQLVSGSDSELCVLITDKQTVYAGITSVKISDGKIMRACPEFNAIMTMIAAGEITVEKLITISFSSKEVSQPCPECVKLLCDTSPDNKDTEIYVSPNQFSKASELFTSNININTDINTNTHENKSAPATEFVTVSEAVSPPPTINKSSKNPLPSANDFVGFATEGDDFGFEAAEAPQEPEEQNEFEEKTNANQDNPFYAPPTMQTPAPNIMQQQSYQQQSIYQQQPYSQPQYQQPPYQQQTSMPNSYYYNQQQYQQPPQPNSYYYNQPQGQQSIYMQPQSQQSIYMQPQGQQSLYMQPQQSTHFNQSPTNSQAVSNYYGQPQQQSGYYSAPPVAKNPESSTFKNRLANFMDDETGISSASQETASLSKAEMLKQAKERKKLAKEAKKRGKN
ncbi:MAG: hypothetical protein K2H93_08355 [Oscillospiraceae bacterium]|nr:hypothetical protein [Oscillospiraceae bacterium]